ncbi:MAG: GTPase [Desulfovibrio fairfieldensis]
MTEAPKGLRLHIALFGRRNAGKSSLLNALSGQPVSIVSDTPGTTTDPVEKTLEMAPLGPVVFLDTAGLDDDGELGRLRAERSLEIMRRTDVALLVTDGRIWGRTEAAAAARLRSLAIPFVVVRNKADADSGAKETTDAPTGRKAGRRRARHTRLGPQRSRPGRDTRGHRTRRAGKRPAPAPAAQRSAAGTGRSAARRAA